MKRLVVASNNAHKLVEIERVLKPLGFEVVPLSEFPEIPDPPETGTTFEANSLQKARFVFEITGLPTIADDSGLEVDALNGAPGVYSKRYTQRPLPTQTTGNCSESLPANTSALVDLSVHYRWLQTKVRG
jgi:XTP/dITP diphosphohydrolase